jgi:hypothetical protein
LAFYALILHFLKSNIKNQIMSTENQNTKGIIEDTDPTPPLIENSAETNDQEQDNAGIINESGGMDKEPIVVPMKQPSDVSIPCALSPDRRSVVLEAYYNMFKDTPEKQRVSQRVYFGEVLYNAFTKKPLDETPKAKPQTITKTITEPVYYPVDTPIRDMTFFGLAGAAAFLLIIAIVFAVMWWKSTKKNAE